MNNPFTLAFGRKQNSIYQELRKTVGFLMIFIRNSCFSDLYDYRRQRLWENCYDDFYS